MSLSVTGKMVKFKKIVEFKENSNYTNLALGDILPEENKSINLYHAYST